MEVPMLVWVLAGGLIVGAPALKEVRRPAKPPIGMWAVRLITRDGLTVEFRNGTVEIAERSITFSHIGGVREDRAEFFTADGAARVDIGSPGQMTKGVWRVDGDELTICTAVEGAGRPDSLAAPKGSCHTLWVLSRVADLGRD
jgi:hypothetical protein